MARQLGSKTLGKADPKFLAARWRARNRQTMRELRIAAGRTAKVIITADGKIQEKWK